MNRRDLHSAFTKINLWRQTQFRKILYVDADVVAYRAPDELFHLPHAFSAAPDIGWPDLFNTGLMVLTPNMGDYYAMMAMAQRGISFDGADQGLLNMYFKNSFHRLSFTYNVTPSAHYQYVPAYKHFQSSISMAHFIGPEKPWVQGRDKSTGSSPFDQMVGRWWAVYDRHYRKMTPQVEPSRPPQGEVPDIVQYFVKGEYQPTVRYVVPVGEPPSSESGSLYGQHHQAQSAPSHIDFQYPQHQRDSQQHSHEQHPHHHHYQDHHQHQHQHHQHQHQHHHHPPPPHSTEPSSHSVSQPSVSSAFQEGTHTEARKDQASDRQKWGPRPPTESEHKPEQPQPQPDMAPSWDAQRQPPPPDAKPEALNFPQTHYAMSSDPAPFVPPERYPSPPKDMWYEVPKEPPAHPAEKPKPVFPWESHQPRPSRVFSHVIPQPEPPVAEPSSAARPYGGDEADSQQQQTHGGGDSATTTTTSGEWSTTTTLEQQASEPQTPPHSGPTSRTAVSAPAVDIWSSFPRSNAWDNVPEINRYVDRTLQRHRRTWSQKLALGGGAGGGNGTTGSGNHLPGVEFGPGGRRGRGSRVTDFPSEDDRPSLPVTPAPIRRPRRHWGGAGGGGSGGGFGDEDEEQLPAAEGVPGQADWVCVHGIWWGPADCLCDLTNVLHYHKDPVAQLQKLAREQSELLLRRLGEGEAGEEEEEKVIPKRPLPFGSEDVRSPTYVAPAPPPVVSPKPVKPLTGASPVSKILAAAPEMVSAQEPPPATAEATQGAASSIAVPSYRGPGAAFEKGEDFPVRETAALPTEEERDFLET
ncbi:glycosyltransferase family 8 protein [Parathielavia hyrcaniae]|uniref:glycogenin glucosyltransferase n=1 Tax=Parathielavia hyrcaniae TaxID=113614 RepID=A0AAN6QCL6_9PEZI|nr:glycosyltransferase family 8 protein [Parathielavia hyrcaniae]